MSLRAPNPLPAGYVRIPRARDTVVALETLAGPLTVALQAGSFYAYAAAHPAARALRGRGVAYAVPLPNELTRVVVRRSRHGGLFAPVTGERFSGGTRAPRELEVSLCLARAAVATPELIAYATYPAGAFTSRADVLTREVPDSADLAATIASLAPGASARPILLAVAKLLAALTHAGARHPDLNIRNILIAQPDSATPRAIVLDVDRVSFGSPGARDITERNVRRLARSARKAQRLYAFSLQEADLQWLSMTTHDLAHRGI